MAEPLFDKEGNLSNADELTDEEVVSAYQEKNKQLFARVSQAEQAEKQAKADKEKAETEQKRLQEEVGKRTPTPPLDQFASKDDLARLELSQLGYDPATVIGIMTYAKGSGKSPLAVLEDEFVKEFIASRKAKSRIEAAVPPPSSRTVSVPLEKPYAQMSEAEKRGHFEKTRQQFFKK